MSESDRRKHYHEIKWFLLWFQYKDVTKLQKSSLLDMLKQTQTYIPSLSQEDEQNTWLGLVVYLLRCWETRLNKCQLNVNHLTRLHQLLSSELYFVPNHCTAISNAWMAHCKMKIMECCNLLVKIHFKFNLRSQIKAG